MVPVQGTTAQHLAIRRDSTAYRLHWCSGGTGGGLRPLGTGARGPTRRGAVGGPVTEREANGTEHNSAAVCVPAACHSFRLSGIYKLDRGASH